LLIILDDFKPLVKSWGSALAQTPNIDKLTKRGINFANAHTQMSFCGPSRASFMTSFRPDTINIFNIGQSDILHTKRGNWARSSGKTLATIPCFLKRNGYRTYGVGKIYHDNELQEMKEADSWTEPVYHFAPANKYVRPPSYSDPYWGRWIDWSSNGEDSFTDGQIGTLAVNLLTTKITADESTPWFFAVGLYKPHLPWHAPVEYFNKFAPSNFGGNHHSGIPQYMAQNGFKLAKGDGCGEANLYTGAPKTLSGQSSFGDQQSAIRAYHATAMYSDNQIGRILDALESTSSSDNTHIIVLGDHGFHLGNHGLYCKHTDFEEGTRSPLLIVPAVNLHSFDANRGSFAWAPVELLDLMPTIANLVQLPIPTAKDPNFLPWAGDSLMPILRNPKNGYVKQAAFSQYFRGNGNSAFWGYSMRTVRYRFTIWLRQNQFTSNIPFGNAVLELYDYLKDPWELVNLAYSPDPTAKALLDQFKNKYQVWQSGGGTTPSRFSTVRGKPPHDLGDLKNMATRPSPYAQYP
jgi:arylsulfatase A-like enzyme